MPTYSESDLERIATAIGKDIAAIKDHSQQFESAAFWYLHDGRFSLLQKPAEQRKKMQQISRSARRLLKSLGVDDPTDSLDGPHPEILDILRYATGSLERQVIRATERIGQLVEIMEAIQAASELRRFADEAADEVIKLGDLIVPKGHQGDAINDWIAGMLSIYQTVTGREPGTSIDGISGKAGGPLIRFLNAAGKPVGITKTPAAWRSRVRQVLRPPAKKKI